jgi:hypothetical protein
MAACMKMLLALAAFPILASCATATEISPSQSVALEAVCTKVMGISHRPDASAACVDTLGTELEREVGPARLVTARQVCSQTGISHASPEFGRCVLEHRDDNETPIGPVDISAIRPPKGMSGGYFSSSFPMRIKRAEYACLAIGIEPTTPSFRICAQDLDGNMWLVEHPSD